MAKLVRTAALGVVLSAAIASDARAHVTLDTPQAPALSYTRVAARVPHGCEGAATVALRLEIPEGVTGVKPMPKPGWTLGIVADEAARAADGPGAAGGHGGAALVREVAWRAKPGEALPDSQFDEFVLFMRTPDAAGQTLWFAFVQECEGGKVSRWTERPAEGQTYRQTRSPAYPMLILPRP